MASVLLVFIISLLSCSMHSHSKKVSTKSPYLSPSLFHPNYQTMLQTLKIYIYEPPIPKGESQISVESVFHSSLLKSPFLTTNGNEAHLFYLTFPPSSSPRSISASIRDLRIKLPFWNRTLGADHFYLGSIGYNKERNLVELKKNSVQISSFPCSSHSLFIPHKDVTLPPPSYLSTNIPTTTTPMPMVDKKKILLGYFNNGNKDQTIPSAILEELRLDSDFGITEENDDNKMEEVFKSSNFCLFFYGGDLSAFVPALRYGCVPVVIADRPILDLPFMDVLKWSEIVVVVRAGQAAGGGGVKETMKRRLERTREGQGEEYEKMREMGMVASQHFVWNSVSDSVMLHPYQYDAFHTILYQLWSRRHTIRYASREDCI